MAMESPAALQQLVDETSIRLRQDGLERAATALAGIQARNYTTSAAWTGDVRRTVQRIRGDHKLPAASQQQTAAILAATGRSWPRYLHGRLTRARIRLLRCRWSPLLGVVAAAAVTTFTLGSGLLAGFSAVVGTGSMMALGLMAGLDPDDLVLATGGVGRETDRHDPGSGEPHDAADDCHAPAGDGGDGDGGGDGG